jgi:hypothetical protein
MLGAFDEQSQLNQRKDCFSIEPDVQDKGTHMHANIGCAIPVQCSWQPVSGSYPKPGSVCLLIRLGDKFSCPVGP